MEECRRVREDSLSWVWQQQAAERRQGADGALNGGAVPRKTSDQSEDTGVARREPAERAVKSL